MKKLFLWMGGLVALVSIAIIAQNPGVNHWEDTWGVRYLFQVGSVSSNPSFIAKSDSSRFGKIVKFDNQVSAATARWVTIDSFLTTATIDTVVMTGASVGDIIQITKYLPAYSTVADTNVDYYARVLNTDSVLAVRVLEFAGADYKSGAQFFLEKINK